MNVTNKTKGLLIDYYETNKKKTFIFSLKKSSSNLLVDKIKSIVAFKMSKLVTISKDGFSYNNV